MYGSESCVRIIIIISSRKERPCEAKKTRRRRISSHVSPFSGAVLVSSVRIRVMAGRNL